MILLIPPRRAAIVALAAVIALPATLCAQATTPSAQTPSQQELTRVSPAGNYLAARHAGTERDAVSASAYYRAALRDGYEIFLPDVRQPMYHFNNYSKGMVETFQFRPSYPTSLLYQKKADGFELVGAMYTAPARDTPADLEARIPLSIARWHSHVNICLPRLGAAATTDWATFGPSGSISTPQACAAAGGRFFPQLFGWMVHVYPFENTVEKIWAIE